LSAHLARERISREAYRKSAREKQQKRQTFYIQFSLGHLPQAVETIGSEKMHSIAKY